MISNFVTYLLGIRISFQHNFKFTLSFQVRKTCNYLFMSWDCSFLDISIWSNSYMCWNNAHMEAYILSYVKLKMEALILSETDIFWSRSTNISSWSQDSITLEFPQVFRKPVYEFSRQFVFQAIMLWCGYALEKIHLFLCNSNMNNVYEWGNIF
jgi:hypothetical protein